MEIFEKVYSNDDLFQFETSGLFSMWQNLGLMPVSKFSEPIKIFIEEKLGKIPTLGELYKLTNKHLIILATDINNSREIILDYQTSPDLNCIHAIEMSCNLPLVFQRN